MANPVSSDDRRCGQTFSHSRVFRWTSHSFLLQRRRADRRFGGSFLERFERAKRDLSVDSVVE
mgnify:FL=1